MYEMILDMKLRERRENYWARIQRETDGLMHDVCLARKPETFIKHFWKHVGLNQREERFPADPCSGLQGGQT